MFNAVKHLKTQFFILLAGVTLLIAATVVAGHIVINSAFDDFRDLDANEIRHERAISGMVVAFKKQVQEWKNVLLRGADESQRAKYWGKFKQQESSIQQSGSELLAGMAASPARDRLASFVAAHKDMGEAYRNGFQVFVESGFAPAAGDRAVKGIDRAPTKLLEEAAGLIADDARVSTDNVMTHALQVSMAVLVTTVVTLALAIVVALAFLDRRIVRPTTEVASALERLAGGDFTIDLACKRNDEIGKLADATRRIRDDLGQLLRGLVETSNTLAASGEELAEMGAYNRTQLEGQRQGTAQVATASEQMAATAKEVAHSAADAADSASNVNDATQGGKTVVLQAIASIDQLNEDVAQVSQTLSELNAQSTAIGNVLDVIRGIAEQTNLLALNAAIEAARAGDQGRGFAVVADEVRSLAQRTQESTQEIQNTIEQLQLGSNAAVQAMQHGQARVTDSVANAREAGDALDQIATAVNTIVDRNAQIATAAEEQGAVAEDVSSNVHQIDRSSGDLVASGQRLAEASTRIAALSTNLVEVTRRFRL